MWKLWCRESSTEENRAAIITINTSGIQTHTARKYEPGWAWVTDVRYIRSSSWMSRGVSAPLIWADIGIKWNVVEFNFMALKNEWYVHLLDLFIKCWVESCEIYPLWIITEIFNPGYTAGATQTHHNHIKLHRADEKDRKQNKEPARFSK